jgi:hypothetical protein
MSKLRRYHLVTINDKYLSQRGGVDSLRMMIIKGLNDLQGPFKETEEDKINEKSVWIGKSPSLKEENDLYLYQVYYQQRGFYWVITRRQPYKEYTTPLTSFDVDTRGPSYILAWTNSTTDFIPKEKIKWSLSSKNENGKSTDIIGMNLEEYELKLTQNKEATKKMQEGENLIITFNAKNYYYTVYPPEDKTITIGWRHIWYDTKKETFLYYLEEKKSWIISSKKEYMLYTNTDIVPKVSIDILSNALAPHLITTPPYWSFQGKKIDVSITKSESGVRDDTKSLLGDVKNKVFLEKKEVFRDQFYIPEVGSRDTHTYKLKIKKKYYSYTDGKYYQIILEGPGKKKIDSTIPNFVISRPGSMTFTHKTDFTKEYITYSENSGINEFFGEKLPTSLANAISNKDSNEIDRLLTFYVFENTYTILSGVKITLIVILRVSHVISIKRIVVILPNNSITIKWDSIFNISIPIFTIYKK